MTRDDVIAALERANGKTWCSQCGSSFMTRACGPTHALVWFETNKSLSALADSLREGQEAWLDRYNIPRWSEPAKNGAIIWIIPAPKVKP